jgi:hypothetical protein
MTMTKDLIVMAEMRVLTGVVELDQQNDAVGTTRNDDYEKLLEMGM